MTITSKKAILILAFFWFFGVLFALAYFARSNLAEFDPNQTLLNASAQMTFDQSFSKTLSLNAVPLKSNIVHFQQQKCQCNAVAAEHIASVQKLAEENGFTNTTTVLTPELSKALKVPSTPAVAVFDEQGELVYLGPYSAGYSCTVGNGIVESYIEGKYQQAPGATVVSDTLGCYCPVS